MLKKITITVDEEALVWARKEAARKKTSVSRLIGRVLEEGRPKGPVATHLTSEETNERHR